MSGLCDTFFGLRSGLGDTVWRWVFDRLDWHFRLGELFSAFNDQCARACAKYTVTNIYVSKRTLPEEKTRKGPKSNGDVQPRFRRRNIPRRRPAGQGYTLLVHGVAEARGIVLVPFGMLRPESVHEMGARVMSWHSPSHHRRIVHRLSSLGRCDPLPDRMPRGPRSSGRRRTPSRKFWTQLRHARRDPPANAVVLPPCANPSTSRAACVCRRPVREGYRRNTLEGFS